MITYKVKPGDTLSQIAYRYQTTVTIIKGDNPQIVDVNLIVAGDQLKIRTSLEFAKDKINTAKNNSVVATNVKNAASPPSAGLSTTTTSNTWGGLKVSENQIGIVTVLKKSELYTLNADGSLKPLRVLNANETYRAYGETSKHGGMYILGGSYVKKSSVSFEKLPDEYKLTGGVGTAILTTAPEKGASTPVTSNLTLDDMNIPQFEMPGYKRTRMQVKKADGKTLTMELRVQSLSASYSNHFGSTRTNEGWAINVGGKNLSGINLNGFLLDTKSNPEATDFLERYNEHYAPKNSDKYFSASITTLLHKNREYKGVIEAVNLVEQTDFPLDRKFSMRFLVLSEKALDSSSVQAKSFTINRDTENEIDFLSDLKNMLANPITGKYNTHN